MRDKNLLHNSRKIIDACRPYKLLETFPQSLRELARTGCKSQSEIPRPLPPKNRGRTTVSRESGTYHGFVIPAGYRALVEDGLRRFQTLTMPRRARVRVAGVPLHVIQRGNNRGACFFDAGDNLYYLEHLGLIAEHFQCAIHAYVLMTNHVHLLLTPEQADSASELMRHLGQRYVQYINRKYKRTGSLWEGRFRSSLVQSDTYLLQCHRYIEMNPVRAGIAISPGEYRWSSFAANAEGKANKLLTPHEEYLNLGSAPQSRRLAYRGLFECHPPEAEINQIRKAANAGYAIGAEEFVKEIEIITGRRVREGKPGRPATSETRGNE